MAAQWHGRGKGVGGPKWKGGRAVSCGHAARGDAGGGGVRCRQQTHGCGGGGIRSVRQGTAAHGPAGWSSGRAWAVAAAGSAHKNSNLFDLFRGIPKRSDLIRLKDGLSELKIFQIK
jgi:hypothetical protein